MYLPSRAACIDWGATATETISLADTDRTVETKESQGSLRFFRCTLQQQWQSRNSVMAQKTTAMARFAWRKKKKKKQCTVYQHAQIEKLVISGLGHFLKNLGNIKLWEFIYLTFEGQITSVILSCFCLFLPTFLNLLQ